MTAAWWATWGICAALAVQGAIPYIAGRNPVTGDRAAAMIVGFAGLALVTLGYPQAAALAVFVWASIAYTTRNITDPDGHGLDLIDGPLVEPADHEINNQWVGQAATVRCKCGQSFTSPTQDMALRAWAKHRRQELGL